MARYAQWPAWRYGPNGEAGLFESEMDVPEGWLDHPDSHGKELDVPPPQRVEIPLSREEIIAALREWGEKFGPATSTAKLYARLCEIVEAAK